MLGGDVSPYWHPSDGYPRKDRTASWWTKTLDEVKAVRVVDDDGDRFWNYGYIRDVGARPAITYSSIQLVSRDVVRSVSGIKETLYGEYPQTIVDENYSRELERAYNNESLKTTGKTYTTDSVGSINEHISFKARTHTEYEYFGSKYIRFVGDSKCHGEVLLDGRTIEVDQAYWVRVEPIIWLVDEEADIALSKKILFSGVQFKNRCDYPGDFNQTDIKQFMDNYFSKEIVTDRVYPQTASAEQTQYLEEKESVRKQNPYIFNFDVVLEEEIIRGAIESKVPVFLHGRSSEGKSARVKQLDPDCEIIYMRNATPDSLNGKSVYVPPITKRVLVPVKKEVFSGENHAEKVLDTYEYEDVIVKDGYMLDVKPSWLVKVEEKCEREPDKLHIIFFDELTNALPSIQGMAFNIILDGE